MDTLIKGERRWKYMKENNTTKTEFVEEKDFNSLEDVFFRFIDAFRRFWYIPLALTIIMGVLGYFYYKKTYVPVYESKAIFNVMAADYSGENKTSYSNNNQLTEDLSVSFNYLINNEVFYEIIKKDLGIGYVPATIEIYPISNTNILNIITRGSDAEMTYKTIGAVLKNYKSVTAFVVGDTKLKVLEEPKKATEPNNPYNPVLGVLLFGFIGFLVGCIPALLYALFIKTIQNRDDVKKYLSIGFIGNLPFVELETKDGEQQSCSILNKDVGFRYVESMRSISSRCERLFNQSKTKVIVVTSTKSGEGKSTFSMNLAYSLSRMQYKVMLIDGDLRKPSLKKKLDVKTPSYSLGDYLNGKVKSSQAIVNLPDTRVLAITPDKHTESPIDVINSDAMKSFMEDVKEVVDYVIIDAPPCSGLSDTAALAQYCDSVIYVVKEDYARVNKIINTLQEFSYTKKPILGCVLNGSMGVTRSAYGYGKYGYGKYGYGVKRRGYGGGQYGMYGYGYGATAKNGYGDYGEGYGYGYGYNGAYGEYGKTSEKEFETSAYKLTKHIKMSSTAEEKNQIELEEIEAEKREAEERNNAKTKRQLKKEAKQLKKQEKKRSSEVE